MRRNPSVPAGCGGVFLAIGPQLNFFVYASGITTSERVAWVHLDHPLLGKIGILATYAPNGDKYRARFWNELADSIDPSRNWIVLGDFNMVIALEDRRGGSSRILAGREKGAWNRFSRKFCLEDTFHYKPGHLKYSWDSKRLHKHDPNVQNLPKIGDKVLKRLDHIYIFDFARLHPFSATSTILPGFSLSNHAPVLGSITTIDPNSRPSLYWINVKHLQEEALVDKLRALWSNLGSEFKGERGKAIEILFWGFYQSKRITRTYGKEKVAQQRKKEVVLREKLVAA